MPLSGRHRGYPGPGRVAGNVLSAFPFENRAGTERNRGGPHGWGTSWGPPFLHRPAPIAQKKSASLPLSRYGCESRWALQKYSLPSGRGVASNALRSQRGDRGCKSRRPVQRPVVKQHHDRFQIGRSRGGSGLACQNSRYRGVADLHTPLSRERYEVSTRRDRHCQVLRVGRGAPSLKRVDAGSTPALATNAFSPLWCRSRTSG